MKTPINTEIVPDSHPQRTSLNFEKMTQSATTYRHRMMTTAQPRRSLMPTVYLRGVCWFTLYKIGAVKSLVSLLSYISPSARFCIAAAVTPFHTRRQA
jgi:hypothetical protein